LSNRPETHGHHIAADKQEACALAVKAGVNIELPEPDCYLHIPELVKKKVLKESQLDELVAPLLYWKFKLGLFDDPYVDPDEDERQIAESVQVVRDADAIVLCIGGNELTSREAWNLNHMGDRTSLELIGRQQELVDAMVATGKPVIVFLFNGRPLSIARLAEQV